MKPYYSFFIFSDFAILIWTQKKQHTAPHTMLIPNLKLLSGLVLNINCMIYLIVCSLIFFYMSLIEVDFLKVILAPNSTPLFVLIRRKEQFAWRENQMPFLPSIWKKLGPHLDGENSGRISTHPSQDHTSWRIYIH